MKAKKRLCAVILTGLVLISIFAFFAGCDKKTDVRMKIKCIEIQNGNRVLPFLDEIIFDCDVDEMYTERAYDGKQYEYYMTGYYLYHPSGYMLWNNTPYEYHTSLWKEGTEKNEYCDYICEKGDYLLTVYTYDELWGSRILKLHIKVV